MKYTLISFEEEFLLTFCDGQGVLLSVCQIAHVHLKSFRSRLRWQFTDDKPYRYIPVQFAFC